MCNIQHASTTDKPFWRALDPHLPEPELNRKIRDKRAYIISVQGIPIGIMRYNLLWDTTPFLTLIYIEDSQHRKGYGRQAMRFWEDEMRTLGYHMVITSTRADEEAQHFYRTLGYIDRGSISLDGTPQSQPQELFMLKIL
ncbi:MAG: GNAT family N-acetyltransferase [Oscillospiraceae bacterium]|nr:GNAT family N-acetyltransferase [Oscillospiraceae bacterium]